MHFQVLYQERCKYNSKTDNTKDLSYTVQLFITGEPILYVAIGGSQNGYNGSTKVEVTSLNSGLCKNHQLKLPISVCNHRAALIDLEEKILVCGGQNSRCGNKVEPSDYNPQCLIWKKGDGMFTPLNPIGASLPTLPSSAKTSQFDFQYKRNDTLYFRYYAIGLSTSCQEMLY